MAIGKGSTGEAGFDVIVAGAGYVGLAVAVSIAAARPSLSIAVVDAAPEGVWRKDGRALTFEYNQRGHQVYRVIEVDAASGRARAVISEEPRTFFYYNRANGTLTGSGKRYRHDVADGREIVWMSERDGWNHLGA